MSDYLKAYTRIERNGRIGVVLTEESGPVEAALFEGAVHLESEIAGRGRIARFALASGNGVLRPYRRGGVVARALGDRYFHNRMWREFDMTAWLYAAGFAVPQPLGVVWERRGPCFRGALATRALDGITLLDYLQASSARPAVLQRCGEQVRALHDAGVFHADLQVKNILVGEGSVWLIDFDNARHGAPLPSLARARNLMRFRRSLEKHGCSLDNFNTILEGYGELGIPGWLSTLYRIRGMVSNAFHR